MMNGEEQAPNSVIATEGDEAVAGISLEDMAQDAAAPAVSTEDALAQISQLARAMVEQELVVKAAEEALRAAKANYIRIEQEDLPTVMASVGLKAFKLDNGFTVEIKDDVQASITEENKPAAHAWLEDNNFGGLIKSVVSMQFGKGDLEKAQKAITPLTEAGFEPEMTESVHWSTLCKFLREQLETPDPEHPVPMELFSARPIKWAKLKAPPKPKLKG